MFRLEDTEPKRKHSQVESILEKNAVFKRAPTVISVFAAKRE